MHVYVVKEKGRVQKQVYIYTKIDKLEDNPDNLPPDYEYYENGVLRTKTEYSTKGNYSTTIVFDKINSVRMMVSNAAANNGKYLNFKIYYESKI